MSSDKTGGKEGFGEAADVCMLFVCTCTLWKDRGKIHVRRWTGYGVGRREASLATAFIGTRKLDTETAGEYHSINRMCANRHVRMCK